MHAVCTGSSGGAIDLSLLLLVDFVVVVHELYHQSRLPVQWDENAIPDPDRAGRDGQEREQRECTEAFKRCGVKILGKVNFTVLYGSGYQRSELALYSN